jgi:hypothetical protein
MTRTLLTGGSGFIAAHILDALLTRGHSVVATLRSQEKAEQIKTSHPGVSKESLDFVIVPDISAPDGSYMFIYPFQPIFSRTNCWIVYDIQPSTRRSFLTHLLRL